MSGHRHPKARAWWLGMALAAAAFAAGCSSDLNTMYGRQSGGWVPVSVNGTDVLAGMFKEAGHEVATRQVLITSKMDTVNTIVWFPNDYSAPNEATCEWFDAWLTESPGRTLVYVGRDFDAAPLYWRSMLPYVSEKQRTGYRQRLLESVSRSRPSTTHEPDCEWFKIATGRSRRVRDLAGPWRKEIDPVNTEIELGDNPKPPARARKLLTTDRDVLVSSQTKRDWNSSRIILVANGSFLLNLPLVNREHRVLAEELIETTGSPGRVVFLESGTGGPPIDPPAGPLGLWRLFGAWPLNVILLHSAALGIIFCFARWPIFGRPRTPPPQSTTDFGKHVDALSKLLRRTGDRGYATGWLSGTRNPTDSPPPAP